MLLQKPVHTLVLASLLSGGCESTPKEDSEYTATQPVTGYGTKANGTGVHIESTQPASWFGLAGMPLVWFSDGFSRHADGAFWATGWYSTELALLPADARILSAQYRGNTWQVQDIRTEGSRLIISLLDASGHVDLLADSALVGLTMLLQVPDPLGLTFTNYRLRITGNDRIDSLFGDVDGYQVDYRQDSAPGSAWSSYCKGSDGQRQRAVFYRGAQWNPLDGSRTDGADLVTMTCESGAVASCMSWGYRPWATGHLASGENPSLLDSHQACIHMKRASYCGDSQANTIAGTAIVVNDSFSPSINSGPSAALEALWTPAGAICLSQRRHPEIPFIGCPLPLPACPENPSGGYLLSSSIPALRSWVRLLD